MSNLTIAETDIRQDEQGRFCLNDLYRASGGSKHHRPSKWMANKQTQALIETLNSEPEFGLRNAVSTVAVGAPTTYVVKELVYAYAMWISPAFHLKVIRAYDALVTGNLAEVNTRLSRAERAYFKRHPKDSTIRALALKGEPYWYIARMVERTAQTVGKAIRRMMDWGLMEERRLRIARIGIGPWSAHRRKQCDQLTFGF